MPLICCCRTLGSAVAPTTNSHLSTYFDCRQEWRETLWIMKCAHFPTTAIILIKGQHMRVALVCRCCQLFFRHSHSRALGHANALWWPFFSANHHIINWIGNKQLKRCCCCCLSKIFNNHRPLCCHALHHSTTHPLYSCRCSSSHSLSQTC